jgi:hypothetical protein
MIRTPVAGLVLIVRSRTGQFDGISRGLVGAFGASRQGGAMGGIGYLEK